MKLNLRSIDLNLLPIFEAVMETRQYSKAAERLAMSQPAMSAAVKRLRDTLDDPLFVRTSKGVVPTPKAEMLYQDICGALTQLRQGLSMQKGFDPSAQPHSFRILSSDYFEFVLLPQLIETVEQDALQIRFDLKPILEDSTKQLIHAQADVMLDAFPIEDDRLHCEVVTEETLVVVARKQHRWLKHPITVQDFFNATHAVLPNRGRLLPLDKILDTPHMQKRKVGVQVTQYISLLAAVANSEYIATVPLHLAERYADALGLAVYDFPIDVPPIPIYMMWSKAFDHDPANKWLLAQLRDVIQDMAGGGVVDIQ
ncbi:MAG: DNA-binding transcriptional LysR family regulator [Oleispira sp.]|jgi:DNA-binding transcriptional LysR family regulator